MEPHEVRTEEGMAPNANIETMEEVRLQSAEQMAENAAAGAVAGKAEAEKEAVSAGD